MVDLRTHDRIDTTLCGSPVETGAGSSTVEMTVTPAMAVDARGLAHGGFVFGLADHAAMIAVNHPTVVLAAAEVKFLKPVSAGDLLVATANVTAETGRRRAVTVTVRRGGEPVFEGSFSCAVLERHILEGKS
ncbi:MAG: PaaI family thioesterase [Spirochaetes bacterium]|nr:PaaI family thioesterase [Spirochaetota bacterium]